MGSRVRGSSNSTGICFERRSGKVAFKKQAGKQGLMIALAPRALGSLTLIGSGFYDAGE